MLHYLGKGHREVTRFKATQKAPPEGGDTHLEFDKLVYATDLKFGLPHGIPHCPFPVSLLLFPLLLAYLDPLLHLRDPGTDGLGVHLYLSS